MNDTHQSSFCLIAVNGDMSNKGMSDTASVVIFNNEYREIVTKFLIAQAKRNAVNMFNVDLILSGNLSEDQRKELDATKEEYYGLFQELKNIGFFSSKYDARTDWEVTMYEDEELESYGKYQIVADLRVVEVKKSEAQTNLSERWGQDIKIHKAYKNDKWYFVYAKESVFYNSKSNKIRIFTIPRLTDDGEKCFSAEIYSDHPADTFNYAIA
jgi:hypothetical protein